MKPRLKLTAGLLVGIVLLNAACTKNSSTPTTASQSQTAGKDVVSSQVGVDLYQSLTGAHGGVDATAGITAPSFINDPGIGGSSSVCGFYVDPSITYSSNVGGVSSSSKGSFAFYFKCGGPGGSHNGLTVTDSLLTTGTAPTYTFAFDVTQYYDVTALEPDL